MFEFVTAAVRNVPGVGDCEFVRAHEEPSLGDEPAVAVDTGERYVIDIRTINGNYGRAVLRVEDRSIFSEFETAVHNFASSIALRLENLAHQARLEAEVARKTVELEMNQAFLQSIIDDTADVVTVVEPDLTIVRANPAAEEMARRHTGTVEVPPVVGRTCHDVFFGLDRPCPACPARLALEHRVPQSRIAPFPDAEHPVRWYDTSASPVLDARGDVVYLIEAARDVTELKHLQDDLRRSADDKELLLREIHHRVKNNLNMVISLLRLQFADNPDASVQQSVTTAIERIRSMSLVHQFLYQSDTQSSIDFGGFVRQVVDRLSQTYPVGSAVGFEVDIADIAVGIAAAAPVSLIVNELVTNALKYAFPAGKTGTITVTTAPAGENEIELVVGDDGVGLPAGFDVRSARSLGMQLVAGLTDQMHGEISVSGEAGTRFAIRFPRAGISSTLSASPAREGT